MRVLLDECLPRRLAQELPGYETSTVPRMRWAGLRNGALLARAAAAGFDVFLTVDRGIEHQQQLPPGIALITIVSPSNEMESIRPVVPLLLHALSEIRAGERVTVSLV